MKLTKTDEPGDVFWDSFNAARKLRPRERMLARRELELLERVDCGKQEERELVWR